MSLDISRLENVRQSGGKTIARCPACAEDGKDEKGDHLVIMRDGRYGCVACPGAAGKSHRQRIFALAGQSHCRTRGACMVRVRRPADCKLQDIAGLLDGIGRFGRVSATYARAPEQSHLHTDDMHTHMFTHMRESEKNPSKPSSPSSITPDIDPETGFPIIDGAICPF